MAEDGSAGVPPGVPPGAHPRPEAGGSAGVAAAIQSPRLVTQNSSGDPPGPALAPALWVAAGPVLEVAGSSIPRPLAVTPSRPTRTAPSSTRAGARRGAQSAASTASEARTTDTERR